MSSTGDAAEQVMRISLQGVEVAAKISGTGAERLALLIAASLRGQKKSKGRTRLVNMLRSEKPLKVFSIRDSELRTFCEQTKNYGVLYCVLKDRDANDGLTDILVKAEDAPKINRIFERFQLTCVTAEDRESGIYRTDIPPENDPNRKEREAEAFLDALLGKPHKSVQDDPKPARTARSHPSEPISGITRASAAFSDEFERPSVRKQLAVLLAEQQSEMSPSQPARDWEAVYRAHTTLDGGISHE